MLMSMTGYGRAMIKVEQSELIVEIKSVNHRYLDISVNLPRQFMMFEDKIKQTVKHSLHRGKIDITITIEGQPFTRSNISINGYLIEKYITAIRESGEYFSLKDDLALSHILQLPDVFNVTESNLDLTLVENLLIEAVSHALEQNVEMRRVEGAHLFEDMVGRLRIAEEWVQKVAGHTDKVTENYRDKLHKRINAFLDEQVEIDEQRILSEVAIFSEKANIDEELTRLVSHFNQFQTYIEQNKPIGRKLDFLIQEMNREINTIGSKGNDYQISQCVVEVKNELEKLREQVQNVE